jgi:hypothetical protein
MRLVTHILATTIALALFWSAASASGPTEVFLESDSVLNPGGARAETLWIFDADFEDLVGDNAGWTTEDRSGTLPITNHWHKDTIRINGFEHLGDSTWWCGAYSSCWRQPRGYGNNWIDCLERDFPLSSWSNPGDDVVLEWDQRVAMEKSYDYGYVDVSTDGGSGWATEDVYTNHGFQEPGMSRDWDCDIPGYEGHRELDLSTYAGTDVKLRFRFESDGAFSSQDQYDTGPSHPVLDGAWQLDNFTWVVNDTTRWYDDCESPGDNGWVHDAIPGSGQAGVVYERRFESFDGHTGWMMAAYDTASGGMIDGQDCHLVSPPIDIAGAPSLVAQWEGWFDLTNTGNDLISLWTAVSDIPDCFVYGGYFNPEPVWGPTYGGQMWFSVEQDWGSTGGWEWLSLLFRQFNHEPMASHGVGFAIDRVRVGVPLETGVPDDAVASVRLGRPHPNPFADETTFALNVPARGRVTLRVVDVAGRVVRTLLDREVAAGEHPLSWDGRTDAGTDVASGVYFARLEFAGGGKTEDATLKLILVD